MMKVIFSVLIISILFVSVKCGYQRQSQFQRRTSDVSPDFSNAKPCTEAEKQKLKKESEVKINADNAYEEDDFDIFMPVIEIPQVKLGKVLSCLKTNFKDGGYSFQMRVKGLEDG